MAEAATDQLNKYLVLFKQDNQIYLDFVGDVSRGDLTDSFTSTVDGSGDFDLSTNKWLKIAIDDGTPTEINCEGGTPAATTLDEVRDAINAVYTGAASHDGTYLTVTSPTGGADDAVTFTPPDADDALALIMGLEETDSYKYRRPYNIPVRISDMNRGAVANPLEYLRRLRAFLLDQMVIDTASGEGLLLWGKSTYGLDKPAGWTDMQYRDFIVTRIMDSNTSTVAITQQLLQFAATVQIIEGIDDGAFSDVSFSDCYRDFPGPPVVKAAFAGASGGMPFFFRVILTGVAVADYVKVVDAIEACRAGGVSYVIQV